MRTSSRCQGSSSGAFFSMMYSRFSCGSSGKRRAPLTSSGFSARLGSVRHQ
jgi:hypothetical protein